MTLLEDKLKRAFKFLDQGNIKQAEILYLQCVDKIENQASELFVQSLHGLAYVKMAQEQFGEAKDIYVKLLNLTKNNSDKNKLAVVYHQLGMVEQTLGHYQMALDYFANELRIYHEYAPEDHLAYAINLFEQGYVHYLSEDFNEATQVMASALDKARQSEDQMTVGSVHHALGDIAAQKKDKWQALEHYEEAKIMFDAEQDLAMVEELTGKVAAVSAW